MRTTASLVGALRVSRIEHSRPRPSTCKGRTGESTSIRFRRASTSGSHPVFSTRRHTHFAKAIDWWAGAIPQPEYQYLNKGDQANSTAAPLNVSVIYLLPFGSGQRFLNDSGVGSRIAGGWQVNAFFTARSGTPFHCDRQQRSLNAGIGTNQTADQVKGHR
jgi:hypothetical protein